MNNTLYSYYTSQISNAQKAVVEDFKKKFDVNKKYTKIIIYIKDII